MTKVEIRNWMRAQRNSVSELERSALNDSIRHRLIVSEEYQECDRLFCFVSFGSEVNTHPIIIQALQDGKQVYAPRVEECSRMEFYHIDGFEKLLSSRFGVPEPLPEDEKRYRNNSVNNNVNLQDDFHTCKFVPMKSKAQTRLTGRQAKYNVSRHLMILPGLAFDPEGNRIGYGAGFYDQYLINYPDNHFSKIALCYDFQVIENIISEEHDRKVDAIITPTRWIQCSEVIREGFHREDYKMKGGVT